MTPGRAVRGTRDRLTPVRTPRARPALNSIFFMQLNRLDRSAAEDARGRNADIQAAGVGAKLPPASPSAAAPPNRGGGGAGAGAGGRMASRGRHVVSPPGAGAGGRGEGGGRGRWGGREEGGGAGLTAWGARRGAQTGRTTSTGSVWTNVRGPTPSPPPPPHASARKGTGRLWNATCSSGRPPPPPLPPSLPPTPSPRPVSQGACGMVRI